MSGRHDEDDAEVRQAGDRVERLLGELRTSTSPSSWARIQELVSALTSVYGRGLGRMLEAFAGDLGIDEPARARLCADPLVESLLLLHGLHPSAVEERVKGAVARVQHAVGDTCGEIASALDSSGALTIRLLGDWLRCPVPPAAIETALRRALEESAPEVTRVTVERDGTFADSGAQSTQVLVQIDLARSHRTRPHEAAE